MSHIDQFNRPQAYPNSVTTGQGGQYDNWTQKGGNVGRLGNNRAPIPTCGIPVSNFCNVTSSPLNDKEQDPACITADSQNAQFGSNVQLILPNSQGLRSSSMESTQQHLDHPGPSLSDNGSLVQSDESDPSEDEDEDSRSDSGLRRSNRGQRKGHYTTTVQEKKKVGRPIAYRGDPNAPELSEQERRRIKRRIANRESARRVRHKRQEILDDLQLKMESLQAQNAELRAHASEIKIQKEELSKQLQEVEGKYCDLKTTNGNMQQEIQALRASLQMKMTALECELDKRDSEAEMMEGRSAFGSAAGQSVSGYTPQPTFPFSSNQMDFKTSQSLKVALDWFPSLNLDDTRAHDFMNAILTDGNGHQPTPVKEEIFQ